jgi:hypothetical protein
MDRRTFLRTFGAVGVGLPLVGMGGIYAMAPPEPEAPMSNRGAWCWFSDPRSFYSARHNRTYVGWVSPTGDIMARQIDHTTGTDLTVTVHVGLQQDDHANPSFIELPDGRVYIFYAHHQASDLMYRWTNASGDIATLGGPVGLGLGSSYWQERGIVPPFSYVNPVYVSGGNRLMVLFRQVLSNRNRWCVAANFNQLASNSWEGYALFDGAGLQSSAYLKTVSNGVDRIDLLLSTGHPLFEVVKVFHARFTYTGGVAKWQNGDGSVHLASVPFGTTQLTPVIDGANFGNAWIQEIACDNGTPVALLYTYPGNNRHDSRYRYARFNGTAWVTTEICSGGDELQPDNYYAPGCTFDGSDLSKVYAARQDATGWRIERWDTADNGATWALGETISPADAVNKQFRPYSPRGYTPGTNRPAVFWWKGRYTTYLDYDAELLSWSGTAVPPPPPNEKDALLQQCLVCEADTTETASGRALAQKLRLYVETL